MKKELNEIKKLQSDLAYLFSLIQQYQKKQNVIANGNDNEFKRLWDLYSKLRKNLIDLAPKFFDELREIELPLPDESNLHFKDIGGYYFKKHLEPLFNEVKRAVAYFKVFNEQNTKIEVESDFLKNLFLISKRFHKVVRQIKSRYSDRPTLEVNDEYDAQDLFHALLSIYFDNIRTEEWTPSIAGSSNRMDFLLKDIQVVIEIKKTRPGLDSKKVGEQLIVDIEKYQSHPDCKILFCFVYDPEGRIVNPEGIEKDLSVPHNELNVFVVIEPK